MKRTAEEVEGIEPSSSGVLSGTRAKSSRRVKPLDYKKLNDGLPLSEVVSDSKGTPSKKFKPKIRSVVHKVEAKVHNVQSRLVNDHPNSNDNATVGGRSKGLSCKQAKLDLNANDVQDCLQIQGISELINNFNDGVQVSVNDSDLEEFEEQDDLDRCWKRRRSAGQDRVNSSDDSDLTEEQSNQDEETVVEPVVFDVQDRRREDSQPGGSNQVIISKATREWLAEQRRQDDIRFRAMMQQMIDENRRKESSKPSAAGTNKTPVKNAIHPVAVKSPSDTTVYAPALARRVDQLENPENSDLNNVLMQNISEFVGSARTQVEQAERRQSSSTPPQHNAPMDHRQVRACSPQPGTSRQPTQATLRSAIEVTGSNEAQQRTEDAIIEGEKFEAAVAIPTGMNVMHNLVNEQTPTPPHLHSQGQMNIMGQGITDDDFFHLMYHVDPVLFRKIESGEFVDLDKLLPKEKTIRQR